MDQLDKVYTSISISDDRYDKFKECVLKLGVDEALVLSVLCYKAGRFVCKEVKSFQTVKYQKRSSEYLIKAVRFLAPDHEYIHANRLACKLSVSRLLAWAIDLFIDEIMEKGINPMEIAHLRIIENSYQKKSFFLRNLTLKIIKDDQFQEYKIKMRMKKT